MDTLEMDLETLYEQRKKESSDICEHLPILRKYASMSQHVTEFGCRGTNSTTALLAGRPKILACYDTWIQRDHFDELQKISEGTTILCYEADVLSVAIEPTDFLFIDTLHTYKQLSRELELHGGKVRKFLAFHDTQSYGYTDEMETDTKEKGLVPAIFDFLKKNLDWRILEEHLNNNGLMVLGKG